MSKDFMGFQELIIAQGVFQEYKAHAGNAKSPGQAPLRH